MNENNIILLKAVADETRFEIVLRLKNEKEVCACKLLELVKCNQSTLSHHMKILVDSGIVTSRKDWKWVHYSINKQKINELIEILK
ncbi:MAG: metalloregulator ArsR/SmtB family transcription factor [Acholeplasmataceae bacterium]